MSINTRIVPFTMSALLNNTVLDLICPPNCQKTKVVQTNHSLKSVLNTFSWDKSSFSVKDDYSHTIGKPVRLILRVAFVTAILVTVSPIGTLYHGTIASALLLNYSFKTYILGQSAKQDQWEKIQSYANACFYDFTCMTKTVLVSAVFIPYYLPYLLLVAESVTVAKIAGCILLSISAFQLLMENAGYSHTLAYLLGNQTSKTWIYLSLSLRNQFGLVDQHGDCLKFSDDQKIKYLIEDNVIQYKRDEDGTNILDSLNDDLAAIEYKMVQKIRKYINLYNIEMTKQVRELQINETDKFNLIDRKLLKIKYPEVNDNFISHQLNGHEIAKMLEQSISSENTQEFNEKILEQTKKLKNAQYKLDQFFHIWRTAMYMSLTDMGTDDQEILDYLKKHKLSLIEKTRTYTFLDNYMDIMVQENNKHSNELYKCQTLEESSESTSSDDESTSSDDPQLNAIVFPVVRAFVEPRAFLLL